MKSTILLCFALLLTEQSMAFTLPNQPAIKAYECANCANLSHESLSLSWVLADKLLSPESLRTQSSHKYQLKASMQELQEGVTINTTAPGAVIRISPANPDKKIKPDFQIKTFKGSNQSLLQASSLFSKDEALKGSAFEDNTLAISKLKPELGSGQFILSTQSTDEDSQYLINVYDANSSTQLTIETDKPRYFYGDELKATLKLTDKNFDYLITSIETVLIDPEGNKIPVEPKALSINTYELSYPLLSEKNANGANWHIQATVSGRAGQRVVDRKVQISFSLSLPSAAIREIEKNSSNSFDFSALIEAATDSRYALQSVLFGTDEQGKIHPMQIVQTSNWLSSGINKVNFSFDSKQKSGYKAPFYIGYTRLTDFGQQKPVFVYDALIKVSNLG